MRGEVNLYMVLDSNYDWCCFAFDTSRNKAKLSVAREFGNEYTEMRCKTLKKGVNVPVPMLVTHPDDKGYDIVKKIEALGTQSGKPKKKVIIADCGQLS